MFAHNGIFTELFEIAHLIMRQNTNSVINSSPADFPAQTDLVPARIMHLAHLLHTKKWVGILPRQSCPYTQRLACALLPNVPSVLWCRGNLELLTKPGIAFIGSRHPEPTGIQTTQNYARAVSDRGRRIVISGNAAGIDETAHRTAIQSDQGGTIAFVPTPPEQTALRFTDHSSDKTGQWLAISVFTPGSKVEPRNFLMRNVLVAAQSHAAFIGETGPKGGTIHTVGVLQKYRRCIFVPQLPPTARNAEFHRLLAAGPNAQSVPFVPDANSTEQLLTQYCDFCPAQARLQEDSEELF